MGMGDSIEHPYGTYTIDGQGGSMNWNSKGMGISNLGFPDKSDISC